MALRVEISGSVCIAAALLCLTLPLSWLAAAMTAALIHEICHIYAVLLTGGTLHRVRIGGGGAVIEAADMTAGKKIACTLAGPAGSLMLLATLRFFPKLALCGLAQGAFNLLPVYPLDGGQILRCITGVFFSDHTANLICKWTENTVFFCISYIIIYLSTETNTDFWDMGIPILLLFTVAFGKIPCKERILAVQ